MNSYLVLRTNEYGQISHKHSRQHISCHSYEIEHFVEPPIFQAVLLLLRHVPYCSNTSLRAVPSSSEKEHKSSQDLKNTWEVVRALRRSVRFMSYPVRLYHNRSSKLFVLLFVPSAVALLLLC